MEIHEEINVIGSGFVHYLLSQGMAFGLRWNNEFGKLAPTLFRIVAMFGIAWYLHRSILRQAIADSLICLALILGGAVGK